MRWRLAGTLCAFVAGLTSCAGPATPTEEAPRHPAQAPAAQDGPPDIGPSTLDPWPRYERARWFEEHGDFEAAVVEYGECINRLPPRHATRPMLDLGKLHQRLGRAPAAERCFREVLDTFPERPEGYRTNPDFRDAALGLSPILRARGAELERVSLRDRFLGELGGTAQAWDAGPPWTRPPAPTPAPTPATAAPPRR